MLKKLGYKDKKKRALFKNSEVYNLLFKSLKKNSSLYDLDREDLSSFKRVGKVSKCSIRNRCCLTFRSGGILPQFKLSRIKFREKAGMGLICGVYKSN